MSATVALDSNVYDIDAVTRAAHRFTDRCHVQIVDQPGYFVVELTSRSPEQNAMELAGDIANAALDELLRSRIRQETEDVRRLILAHAFSRTDILHPHLDRDPEPVPAPGHP